MMSETFCQVCLKQGTMKIERGFICEPCFAEMAQTVFPFLMAWDDDNLPDGAWWAKLSEGVESYNSMHPERQYEAQTAITGFLCWLVEIGEAEFESLDGGA